MKPHIRARRNRWTGKLIGGWEIMPTGQPSINDWCTCTFEHAVRVAVAMATGQPIPAR